MAEAPPASFEVAADHPIFAGHFPGRPIVPGVMLLEWVQSEAARLLRRAPATLRVREAKFFTPLEPGQRALVNLVMSGSRCSFEIRREATAIARGVLEWEAGG
jgi:3-hydroxymyristoyl/3-hydroxydecanoyl-(acyl carrier protein) dehydratase